MISQAIVKYNVKQSVILEEKALRYSFRSRITNDHTEDTILFTVFS